MATKTRIIKAAVVRLGEEAPQAITEDTDPLIAAEAMYESMAEELLCDHEWSFATKWTQITRTTSEAPEPWSYLYELPSGLLNVRDLREITYGAQVDFELAEDKIYTRHEGPLSLVHTWRAPEERWPADFAGAVEEELLGRLLGAFEERLRSIEAREIAAGKLAKARRRDRRQKPPFRITNAPLLRAWYGRATRRP